MSLTIDPSPAHGTVRRDLLAVAAGTVAFFIASAALELSEGILAWTRP